MPLQKIIYQTRAVSTGGRNGQVSVPGSDLNLTLASPPEMGGSGDGANPEQLFAAGYAACFASALELVARQKGIETESVEISAEIAIGPVEAGYGLQAKLTANVGGVDHSTATALVEAAHAICPYSNATRGNMDVSIEVAE